MGGLGDFLYDWPGAQVAPCVRSEPMSAQNATFRATYVFWGSEQCCPKLWVKPQHCNFGGLRKNFKPEREKFKSYYYAMIKFYMNCPYGPKAPPNKSRMADSDYLEFRKTLMSACLVNEYICTIGTELKHQTTDMTQGAKFT